MQKSRITSKISLIAVIAMVLIGVAGHWLFYAKQTLDGFNLTCSVCDLFELLIMAILFHLNVSDEESADSGKFFANMIFMVCLMLFTDMLSYFFDGIPELIAANYAACTATYLCGIPIDIFLWLYCEDLLKVSEKRGRLIRTVLIVLGIINAAALLTNPFTGKLFIIDSQGTFELAEYYRVMAVETITCGTICAYEVLRSKIKVTRKIMLLCVFLAPAIGILLSLAFPALTILQYLCMTTSIFVCFINIYVQDANAFKAQEKELAIAADIQRGALRNDFGECEEYTIYAYMKPAREVGGDFYDFFDIDDETVGLLIADVSGKGIPAAMFMMQGLTAIRELAKNHCPIDEVFERANNILCAHNVNELFITAWLAYLNKYTGEVRYVNAGHNPPIIKRADGSSVYEVTKPSLVLAALEDIPYKVHEMKLERGDILFMYTDGLPEAQNANRELYNEDRLKEAAARAKADPTALSASILRDINSFVDGAEQFDDMTIIATKLN